MSEDVYEVVIAGGGMAGATLGLALARAGLKVAVVDAQPLETRLAPEHDGRASAIAYAAFRQWRALGLGPELESVSQPIHSILVSDSGAPGAASPARSPAFLRFDAAEIADRTEGEPLAWMVENRHTRAALNTGLVDAGATLVAPARVSGLEVEGRTATIRLEDGRTLAAPLVVGAEGRRSAVRDAAAIRTIGWRYPQDGVVATVKLERPHDGIARELFLGRSALAILPMTEDRASLVWAEPPAIARALVDGSVDAFEAHLARRFGEVLGRPRLAGPRFAYPLSLLLAETMAVPRVALLGDAAHGIHPVAGQGLNLGLKDAAALAEVVVEARRLGEDIGSLVVLERYSRWRRFDVTAMAAASEVFTRFFAAGDPVSRILRRTAMAVTNRAAPLRKVFMREAGADLGHLPRLLRGEPLA